MTDDKKKKQSTDDQVHDAIGEIALRISNDSDNLLGGAVAGIVVGGTLYGGYHATKFTVQQAKKQSKHVKTGAAEVTKQAKRVVSSAEQVTRQAGSLVNGADQVKTQAEQIAKKMSRRGKKKDEPEQFPRL